MGSNDVVSIRVEALGVSITIADGNIAIKQTKTEIPTVSTAPKVESPAAATNETVPASAVVTEHVPPLPKGVDDSIVRRDSGAKTSAIDELEQFIDELEQTPSRGGNGLTGLPREAKPVTVAPGSPLKADAHSGKGQETRSSQIKPLWSDEEVEKLRALYPTYSTRAIATQLGRGFVAIRSKAQNLGLRKAAPPVGTALPDSQEIPVRAKRPSPREKPAPKPRSLSAAVTADPAPVANGFSAVSLLDHHPGQCRWIISDVWPVMYCGAPVVDCSSWCEQHSKRVFNYRPQRLVAS